MIRKLHHNAYRCRDSEETRRFYEDFLGLRLAGTLEIKESKSGRRSMTTSTAWPGGISISFVESSDCMGPGGNIAQ